MEVWLRCVARMDGRCRSCAIIMLEDFSVGGSSYYELKVHEV